MQKGALSMPKHRRIWNASVYEKYIREGRGCGSGLDYTPWIHVQDFASRGVVSRTKGMTTGRVHHLMSNNELAYFYLLDWSDKVTDIREQYPLIDLERAVNIAWQAGIKYPTDKTSGYPYVLTCDFMVTTVDGMKARTIKASSELSNLRVLEKLEIERRYWSEQRIDWKIITEHEIPYQRARNIEWLYTALFYESPDEAVQNAMLRLLSSNKYSVIESARAIENEFCLTAGIGLQMFKHFVLNRAITVNLDTPLNLNMKGIVTEV